MPTLRSIDVHNPHRTLPPRHACSSKLFYSTRMFGEVFLRQLATFLLIAGVLAGWASSPAVVQSGPGTYTLSKEAATSASGLARLKADALEEANRYCAKNGREVLLVGAKEQRGEYLLSYYRAEINFRCVAMQAMREATKAAILECRDKRLKQEFRTYKQSAECSNPKILAAYEGSDYPYMDLVRLLLDARLVAAQNLDKGAVTEAQAEEQSAELERRLTSEEQRRRAAVAVNQAQPVPSDAGAFLQGLNAFQIAKRAPAKRLPTQRTALACNTVGFGGGLSTTSCY
jgi:hypothetical protein